MNKYQINEWVHRMIREHVKTGDICIDATAGNGGDTEILCELTGECGYVLAFDIQSQALENTRARLQKQGLDQYARLILDSHVNMGEYAALESVACIMFNFGYLPGGDHHVATNASDSVKAVERGMGLLKKDGIISLCIYSGGDTGYAEKDSLLEFIKKVDQKKFLVIVSQYYNRHNDPPILALIIKLN